MSLRLVPAGLIACAIAVPAYAHFVLVEPESYAEQTILGDPQKNPPCGQFDTIRGPTGAVTTYESGQLIEVTIRETIYHPGHYRVAIAQTPEELPDTPPVTAGRTDCESTIIDEDPQLPVLADGVLIHDAPIPGDRTFEVQLPEGFTCDNCTLQVVQFMSDHALNVPGGCYYHHCATVTITAPEVPDEDAGADAGAEVGGDADTGADGVDAPADAALVDSGEMADTGGEPLGGGGGSGGGCATATPSRATSFGLVALLGLALVGRGSRRVRTA